MNGTQLAAVNVFPRNGLEIYAFQTAHIHRPLLGRRARTPKRLNSAHRAEVVLRGFRVPLIQRQVIERCEKLEVTFRDPMKQPASATAH